MLNVSTVSIFELCSGFGCEKCCMLFVVDYAGMCRFSRFGLTYKSDISELKFYFKCCYVFYL